jgi:hypothetical protein
MPYRDGRSFQHEIEAGTSRATLIRNLTDEQYEHPVRIVAFKWKADRVT